MAQVKELHISLWSHNTGPPPFFSENYYCTLCATVLQHVWGAG